MKVRPYLTSGLVIAAMCVAAVLAGVTIWNSVIASSDDETTVSLLNEPASAESKAIMAIAPVRLSIPSLNVDAAVQSVGISKRGSMAVPTNYADVGWYRYRKIPGHEGSAVMAGHLDNGFGLPGVFRDLKNIRIGADVYVTDANGAKSHFKVVRMATLDSSTTATDSVFGASKTPMLNLITCEGEWNPVTKTYSNRLVVFTELASVSSR